MSKAKCLTVIVKHARICFPGLAVLSVESDPDNDGTFCIYASVHFDRKAGDLLGLQVVKRIGSEKWEVIT